MSYDTLTSNGMVPVARRTTRSMKPKRATTKRGSDAPVKPNPGLELKPAQQRVFLYIQLKSITLPTVSYPLELHLYHANNTLQTMSEHYTTQTIIKQEDFDAQRPTFAMGIIQDSLDELNAFSDNPLVISMYARIPRHRKGTLRKVHEVRTSASSAQLHKLSQTVTETDKSAGDWLDLTLEGEDAGEEAADYVPEHLEFISRGHCDLLQLFRHNRFIANIPIWLYPRYDKQLQTATCQKITTTSDWHMYSILPMLKNFSFCNLAFITLESIYNAPPELSSRAETLGMCICIRATKADLNHEFQVLPLCNFYGFSQQIISAQSTCIVWENIKRDFTSDANSGFCNNQIETTMRIKLPRLFRQLLKTEGVDLKLSDINPFEDEALINNSLHRFVLTKEMREILEAAIVHNEYELLLQLYSEVPANVLLEGPVNLSIFGYPDVNTVRFASQLSSVSRKTKRTFRISAMNLLDKPVFAIIKLCFFQPLTQRNDALDAYNESPLRTAKLQRCNVYAPPQDSDDGRDILKELYRNFDELMGNIIAYIISQDVSSVDERRGYFCCQLGNLRNMLMELCGSDFNMRMPTHTNIEFREMLTHMYAQLMQRIEQQLQACGWQSLANCVVQHESEELRTRRLLEEFRTLCLLGDCGMAKQLLEQLKVQCSNKLLLNFYLLLHDVEFANYARAAAYMQLKRETNWDGEYFVELLKLYVDYQLQLAAQQSAGAAFAELLEQLRVFTRTHSLDREAWILLYCYYKRHKYLPGMEYTRWKFEDLYDVPSKQLPPTPRPLYCAFMSNVIDLSSKDYRTVRFYEVFKMFARLGAYEFAEVVFNDIAEQLPIEESYLTVTTLKMLQGKIEEKYQILSPTTKDTEEGRIMRYRHAHINGNAEYSRQRYDEAFKHFSILLEISNDNDEDLLCMFYLSLLRLAQLSFNQGELALAKAAYEKCLIACDSQKSFVANYGLALTLYYLNELERAIEHFARCTEAEVFVPDVWGYLAIANLRLARNKTAANCWKMAKLHPELPLHNRIYAELEKIKYSDISLLVDDDGNPAEEWIEHQF
ncbi:CG14339 [Drosophila busckii]|uniref:CG14339 n=1 Tax=Drosophila busckii TaxID=30019 RepID=A0A0M4EB70_DROBS|nr:uncharacterized protein LOC108594539 [Drosophila busckii]ALC38622.1 CG14339 [Drosophila busckii]